MLIRIEFEMPVTCGECRFYKEIPYSCMFNERGMQAGCNMGYMSNKDMRDKSYRTSLFEGCKLKKFAIKEI